jgi:hypothetical protein
VEKGKFVLDNVVVGDKFTSGAEVGRENGCDAQCILCLLPTHAKRLALQMAAQSNFTPRQLHVPRRTKCHLPFATLLLFSSSMLILVRPIAAKAIFFSTHATSCASSKHHDTHSLRDNGHLEAESAFLPFTG